MDYLLENNNDLNEENSKLYNLYAITVHVGQGNEYGHYYCILKISGKWFKFDDEIISVIYIVIFIYFFIVIYEQYNNSILDSFKTRNK